MSVFPNNLDRVGPAKVKTETLNWRWRQNTLRPLTSVYLPRLVTVNTINFDCMLLRTLFYSCLNAKKTPCSKQVGYQKFMWKQRDSNPISGFGEPGKWLSVQAPLMSLKPSTLTHVFRILNARSLTWLEMF